MPRVAYTKVIQCLIFGITTVITIVINIFAEVPRVATKVIQCMIFVITTVITIVINNSIIFVTITAIIIIFIAINISEDFCTYF